MAMRSRLACLGWATAATVGGLLSRRVAHALPQVIAEYAGDVLWAFMVFWLLTIVAPGARTALLAACAFSVWQLTAVIAVPLTLFSAASAAGSLQMARKGERSALESGTASPEIGDSMDR